MVAIFFIAGCFMDLIALIVILGPILAPTLSIFNIDPILFGIMCVMCVQISYITPPFGLNLYATMGMRKRTMMQVSKSILPYLLILIVVTLAVCFIPQISLFLPNMMNV